MFNQVIMPDLLLEQKKFILEWNEILQNQQPQVQQQLPIYGPHPDPSQEPIATLNLNDPLWSGTEEQNYFAGFLEADPSLVLNPMQNGETSGDQSGPNYYDIGMLETVPCETILEEFFEDDYLFKAIDLQEGHGDIDCSVNLFQLNVSMDGDEDGDQHQDDEEYDDDDKQDITSDNNHNQRMTTNFRDNHELLDSFVDEVLFKSLRSRPIFYNELFGESNGPSESSSGSCSHNYDDNLKKQLPSEIKETKENGRSLSMQHKFPYRCDRCDHVFEYFSLLERHAKVHKPDTSSSSSSSYTKGQQQQKRPTLFRCNLCKFIGKNKNSIKSHVVKNH